MTNCSHHWCMSNAWNSGGVEVEYWKCQLCAREQVKLLVDGGTHPTSYGSEVTDKGIAVSVSFSKKVVI